MTFFMSLKETFGAASRSSASLAWNASRCSGGTRPTSRKLMTCPSFIAAPFIVPSTATICSAVSSCRRSSAFWPASSLRATFAARVPNCLAAVEAATPPIFDSLRRREVGISSLAIRRGRLRLELRPLVGRRGGAARAAVNQLLQAPLAGRLLLGVDDPGDTRPAVRRDLTLEERPGLGAGAKTLFGLRRQLGLGLLLEAVAGLLARRERREAGRAHPALLGEDADALDVALGPLRAPAPRRDPLAAPDVVDRLHVAVDPADAEDLV